MTASIRRFLRWLWPEPEPALSDAGRNGEQVIARIRFWVIAVIALVPVITVLRVPTERGGWAGLGTAMVALAFAWLFARLVHRRWYSWMGFATSAFDVTVVTLFHLLLLYRGELPMGLGSRITFAMYLIAITATTLRYDGRICVSAGLLAVTQWMALMAWADWYGIGERALEIGSFYGVIGVLGQIEEAVVLLVGTALSAMIVWRTRALRLSSTRDSLTELHNRAFFDERIVDELERARRHRRMVALALIDVDHFKRVNDTLGHQQGDEVLRAVSGMLRRSVRRTDLLARFGGEEFVLAMTDTSLPGSTLTMETIRRSIESTPVMASSGREVAVTVSAGIALYPVDAEGLPELIAIADRRLFAAKGAGRNRVVSGADEESSKASAPAR